MPDPAPPTDLIRGLINRYPNPNTVDVTWCMDEHDPPCESVRHAHLGARRYESTVTALCGSEFVTGRPPDDPEGPAAQAWSHGRSCSTCTQAAWWFKIRQPHPTYG